MGPITLYVTDEIEPLETVWEALQSVSPCSPSQTFNYARAWQRHVLQPEGRRAIIAIGYDADRALFLWPFELRRKFGQTVLVWLGQDHANYNMGLFTPGVPAQLKGPDIARLLNHIGAWAGASAALLEAQPFEWGTFRNPVAELKHQPHPSEGYAVKLGDFEELYHAKFKKASRRKYTTRERKLGEEGELVIGWASSDAERKHVLETFFAQRETQFAAMGVEDPFTPPIRDFFRELAFLPDDDPARLRLGYIRVGDFIAATFSGSVCQDTLAVCMSSLGEGDMQRYSPGLVLLRRQIEWACNEGLAYYDIGVGGARHKERWSDVVRELFDSYQAFTPQGYLLTLPLTGFIWAKRRVKQNKYLWPLAKKVRRALFGKQQVEDED